MGLLSSIKNALGGGGGGGSSVTQQAANTTNVEVGVGIEMDMGPIAAIMEWLGLKQVEYQDKQVALTQQGNMTVQQLLTSLQENENVELKQKQQVIDGVLPWVSRLGLAVLLALGVLIWKKWSK